jgi:hypothetical protein
MPLHHLAVLDRFEVAEAGDLGPPVLVEPAVDDAHDAAHRPAVLEGQEHGHVAIAESLVLLGVEIFLIVHQDGMNPVRPVGVELLGEEKECFEVLFRGDFTDFNAHARSCRAILPLYPLFQGKCQNFHNVARFLAGGASVFGPLMPEPFPMHKPVKMLRISPENPVKNP